MSTISRRKFLGKAGLVGAGAVMAEGAFRGARAEKPVNFSGWVFKPDTVKDYVEYYNKKHNGQVKYEAIPWANYHPTMETRAFAGEVVDVMYCNAANRERWFENGPDPGPRRPSGHGRAEEEDRPRQPRQPEEPRRQQGHRAALLHEPLHPDLQRADAAAGRHQGARPRSWEELVEHCTKLKRDKVSDTPFLPNWNNSGSGTMPQFISDCFSEGASVFDAKNKVIADQEPGAARAMERWQKVYKAGLVNPEVLTKTSSTDTHRLFWTGRYAYHTNHSYYLKTIAGEPENSKLAPKKAKMAMYPGNGTRPTCSPTSTRERQDQGARGRVEAR